MLNGQVALVTGAGRGIGRAIALALAKNGADIVISDIMKESVDEAVKEVEALGRKALGILGDVSKFADCEAMVNAGKDAFGKIDILVNNAGITRDNLIMRMSEEDWDAVIAVNLKSVFNCCKAVCRLMMKQKGGRIINISSVVGLMGNAGQANYSASKAGIIGLTKTLAKELGRKKVLVNAVNPGFMKSSMTAKVSEKTLQKSLQDSPLKVFSDPEEVAGFLIYLSSDLMKQVTGQVFHFESRPI